MAVVDVKKPTVTNAEISADVKAVPDMVVDVGFAFITELYFTNTLSVSHSSMQLDESALHLMSSGSPSCE